jgi:hypothetical protein
MKVVGLHLITLLGLLRCVQRTIVSNSTACLMTVE